MDIIGRINAIMNTLSNSEQKIAQFIINNPNIVPNMQITELAEHADSSASAVTRLCKKLKVKGFTTLKIELALQLKENIDKKQTTDIDLHSNFQELSTSLLNNSINTMSNTLNYLNEDNLNKIITHMHNSDQLFTFGIGASGIVAKNITQKWIRIGKNILNFDDIHQLMTAMMSFSKNASIILVSNSGQTKEILDIAKFAREKSITTIGITQFGDHPLGKLANLNIHTAHTEEAALRSAATSSLHAQFFIVDILFYLFIQKYHDQYIENIQETFTLFKKGG